MRNGPVSMGLSYTVQACARLELDHWSTGGGIEESAVEMDAHFETVTSRIAVTEESGFVRCRVESAL
jgi:hypothetical protein